MRNEILEIAERQMKLGGHAQVNFGKIASELNTTRANLHYHFKNKETLATEVTKRYMADDFAEFSKISAQYEDDFIGFIIALEECFWEKAINDGKLPACVCAQVLGDPTSPCDLVKLAQQHHEDISGFFFSTAARAVKAGKVKKGLKSETIALQAASMMIGVSQMGMMSETIVDAEKMLNGIIKNWIKELRP